MKSCAVFENKVEEIIFYRTIQPRPVMIMFMTPSGFYMYCESDREVEVEALPQLLRRKIRSNHFYKYKLNEINLKDFMKVCLNKVHIENDYDWEERFDIKELKLMIE